MERTFTINDIISIFLKRLWLIVALTVIGGTVAYVYSEYVIPKKYTSSVTLYVSTQQNEGLVTRTDITFSERLVETYLVILKSNQVLEAVSQRIKHMNLTYTPSNIGSMLKAAAVESTEVFEVSISCEDKDHAQIIANTISVVAPPAIESVVGAGQVAVVDKAILPTRHSTPNIPRNTILGILIGMALGGGIAFLLELMNTSIKSKEDLVETYKFPVLTMIPNLSADTGRGGYKYYKYKYEYGYGYEDVVLDDLNDAGDGGGKDETIQ